MIVSVNLFAPASEILSALEYRVGFLDREIGVTDSEIHQSLVKNRTRSPAYNPDVTQRIATIMTLAHDLVPARLHRDEGVSFEGKGVNEVAMVTRAVTYGVLLQLGLDSHDGNSLNQQKKASSILVTIQTGVNGQQYCSI